MATAKASHPSHPSGARDRRTLPLGLRRYRPGVFDRFHQLGSRTLGASGVPALFGQSRFAGRFALACHLLGRQELPVPNEAMLERGRRLQKVVGEMLAEQTGWAVEDLIAYAPHRDIAGLISSPDNLLWRTPHVIGDAAPESHFAPGIGELKVVAEDVYQRRWHNEVTGEREPPLDVVLQHQTQYACTGASWGAIAALVIGRYRFELVAFETTPEPEAIAIIEREAAAFLEHIRRDELPAPDDHHTSIEALATLYPNVDPGKSLLLTDEEAEEGQRRFDAWEQATLDRKAAEATEEASKNWFLIRSLPDAGEVRIGNDRIVSIKRVHRKAYTRMVEAGSYRKWSLQRASDRGDDE